jgi:hypothetical protein
MPVTKIENYTIPEFIAFCKKQRITPDLHYCGKKPDAESENQEYERCFDVLQNIDEEAVNKAIEEHFEIYGEDEPVTVRSILRLIADSAIKDPFGYGFVVENVYWSKK